MITPDSLAFRLSCYENFGWKPEDIKQLPETEAMMLAVYFEELANYHNDERRKSESSTSRTSSEDVVDIIGDDYYEDDE